ncbi:MAG: hypothetical protein WDO71_03345 [Bacteroidota bacterium]
MKRMILAAAAALLLITVIATSCNNQQQINSKISASVSSYENCRRACDEKQEQYEDAMAQCKLDQLLRNLGRILDCNNLSSPRQRDSCLISISKEMERKCKDANKSLYGEIQACKSKCIDGISVLEK